MFSELKSARKTILFTTTKNKKEKAKERGKRNKKNKIKKKQKTKYMLKTICIYVLDFFDLALPNLLQILQKQI